MITVLYVLAFLALAFISGLSVGVVYLFAAQLAHDRGRRRHEKADE